MCKSCNKMRQREWASYTSPSRMKAEEIVLSPQQKSDIYHDVIIRMRDFGIMSQDAANEALKRVRNN